MAENDGRYGFGVTLTDESVKRVAEEVKKEFQGMSQSAAQEGAKMESSFRKIGTALGVGFSLKAAEDFGKQIVKVRGEIESLEVSFRTLLGSEQKATALMTDIRKFAATTPMQLNDLASGAQTLLGFNIEAEKVMPTLKALGDISIGDSQKFQYLTLAFAQMSSTGKLMGQDLLQMINAGFNPLVQIAERTGKSVVELKEEMSQGKISVEMVTQAFMDATSEGGRFYNMLEKQSKGIQGSLSNLKGAFDDMLNDIGENSDGVITKSVQGLTKLVQNYETVGKVIGTLVATYGSYKAAVMAYNVIATISNGLTAGLTAKEIIHAYTLGVVTKAQKLLNATMLANPYVLCATLLISLAAAIAITADRTSEAERQQKAYNDILEENNKKYEEVTGKIEKFIGIIKDETQTLYDRNEAYKEFMKLFPEYFKQFEGNFAEAKKAADELMNDEAKRHEAELNERIAAAKKQMERYEKLWQDYEYAFRNGTPGEATNNDLLDDFLREHENEAEEHGYNGGFLNFHQASNTIKYLKDYRAQTKKVYEDMVRDKEEAEKELVKQKQHEEWLKLPREDRIKGTTKVIKQLEGEVENLQKKMEGAGMMEQKYYSLLLKRYQMQLRKFRELKDEAESEPDFASLKKATQNAYNAMQRAQKLYKSSPTKANEEAYDKAKEDFETKDKQYEKATGKKYSDQLKDAKDRAKEQKELNNALKKEQEEYAKWLKQQSVEADFEARQAGIDAMKEGLDKTIAQINLDYDRQKATIEAREEEMVEKLRDLKEAEWNVQNPTKKKNGEKFDRSTVTAADLTQEQQDQLTAYTEQALAERNRLEREAMDEMTGVKKTYLAQQAEMERQYIEARKLLVEKGATEDDLALFDRTYQANQKALFNEMLGDYVSYQQQMTDYTEEYENKRAELEELMAKTNDPTKKKNIKQAIDMLEKEYKRGFSNLQRTFIEDNIGDVFVEATYENVKEAIQKLTEMEGYKDAAEFNAKYGTNITDAEFSSFIANVKKVKREIQDLGKGGYTLRDAFKDAFSGKTKEDMDKGTKTLIAGFQKVGSIVSGLASAMREFADATGDAHLEKMADTFESIADTISTAGGYAAAGAQIGGGWGAVIGAVLGIGQSVLTSIFKSKAQEEAEQKQRQDESIAYMSEIIAGINTINDTVKSLAGTITGLDYKKYASAMLEFINVIGENRFDADQSAHSWRDAMNRNGFNANSNNQVWEALYYFNPDGSPTQLLQQQLDRYGCTADYSREKFRYGDARWWLRDLMYQRAGGSGDPYAGGLNHIDDELFDEIYNRALQILAEIGPEGDRHGNAYSIGNGVAWALADYIQDRYNRLEELKKEFEAAYYDNSFDSTALFNLSNQVQQTNKQIYEAEYLAALFAGDEAKAAEYLSKIRELEYQMTESLRNMFESLVGADLQSIVDNWLNIFKKFGNNFTGAIDEINKSIDDMIRNMVVQFVYVQPLMKRLTKYLQDYAASHNLAQDEYGNYIWTNEAFVGMAEGLRDQVDGARQLYQDLMAQLNGMELGFDSASERTAAAHGIGSFSQESMDEANGRLTAVQGHTFNISENSNIVRDMVVSINGSVHQIEIHTQHLIRMDNDIHNLKASFDTIINSNGIRIRN